MFQKHKKVILICLFILSIFSVSGLSYYIGQSNSKSSTKTSSSSSSTSSQLSSSESSSSVSSSSISSSSSSVEKPKPIFSGTVKKLDKDLGLIKPDELNLGTPYNTSYYFAGKILDGKYKDYDRIFSITDSQAIADFQFLTTNYLKYILINARNNSRDADFNNPVMATDLKEADSYNSIFISNKIEKLDTFSDELPDTLNINEKYSLKKTKRYMNFEDRFNLIVDYNKLTKLNIDFKYSIYTTEITNPSDDLKSYASQTSLVTIPDSSGLPFIYSQDIYTKKVDLTDINSGSFYEDYQAAFPAGCVIMDYTLKNISDGELEKVASKNNKSLFALKDKNHPLYKVQYSRKVEQSKEFFSQINSGVKKPNYQEYVASNPLLFFKDGFNRLSVVGEWDYRLYGGCGKPVIYLYPQTTQEVSVKFTTPINLTTDIPKYNLLSGWKVLATPDSQLTDLQPQFTNCDNLDSSHFGSEYAKISCQKNNYPYLYWSGNRLGVEYPKMDKGWIIEKKNLSEFLDSKLDEMGLNAKEKSDMIEYWLPYLANKTGDYFRLSFLQTKEMNQIAPMNITPRPNTVFRIFLDWDNYQAKPGFELQPQNLDKLSSRNGFTVVEWGGLKK